MRYISGMLVAMVMVVATTTLSAQEHKRVEVTKNYMHEVSPAEKIVAPTDINDAPVIEPEIEYNVSPETWQIKLEDHNFNPASASYWDESRSQRLFMRLAAGVPLATDVAVRYATHTTRLGYFGVGVDHDANLARKCNGYGDEVSVADSYSMTNSIDVIGGVMAGRQMFEASVDYTSDIVNRYAMQSPDRIYFHDANMRLRYGDDFTNLSRFNFGVEAAAGYWREHLPFEESVLRVGEVNAVACASLARDFKGNILRLDAGFGLWKGDKYTNYQDMAANIAFSYYRKIGVMSLKAEMQYMYDKVNGRDKASHFFMPAVKLDFDFGKSGIRPYVEFATNVTHNGIESLYVQNRFVAFVPMMSYFNGMASTCSYDLHLGFAGSDRASKVAYRLYIGGSYILNHVFWYVNQIGTFGFAQENNARLFAGAEIEYHPVGGLKLAASVRGPLDKTNTEYAVSDPKFVASGVAEYRLKRWLFSVGADYIGKRTWSGVAAGDIVITESFHAPVAIDLHAEIAFVATSRVELFVKGCNLLDKQIYDYAYYYRNGIGAMAGLKIDF